MPTRRRLRFAYGVRRREALFETFFISVISPLFAMMFKWLPVAAIDWYDVWLRAIVTAALFEAGKSAIGFYIGKQGLDSTYGAAASIIVVLIWVYYSSQIILMGAEITHAFAKHRGSIKLREGARTTRRTLRKNNDGVQRLSEG
jgi:uncharacterized BrkB/YihY/UPF0761 family membrane protein